MTAAASPERAGALTRDAVVAAASRIVERDGHESLTMRRLADDLGAAVTAIYWHAGNRDTLLDLIVEQLLAEMDEVHSVGDSPHDRIAFLARELRERLLDRPHLIALVNSRGRIARLFQPVQVALAAELAALGLHGADAAIVVRAVQCHVAAFVTLERVSSRTHSEEMTDPAAWPDAPADRALVAELSRPPDYEAIFEYGLAALLATLPAPARRPRRRAAG